MGLDISKSNDDKDHAAVFFANVVGKSDVGIGVGGTSTSGTGVKGDSTSGAGVFGSSTTAQGVWGESQQGEGVHGISHSIAAGVAGYNDNAGAGVFGESQNFDGVVGESHSNQHAGVTGRNTAGGMAGFFDGDVVVTGDMRLVGADFAEEFDILYASDVEPGTVMVLDQEGALGPSQHAYDKRVAGVISGAGLYKPGIVLDKRRTSANRMPIALVGKVDCKVDAQYSSIEVGDLLTTSLTPGVDGKIYCNIGKAFINPFGSYNKAYPLAGQMLIHELTHAWQIAHAGFLPGLMCSAIVTQADFTFGDNVYQYGPAGPPWWSFNPEQQGAIVDQWFVGKQDGNMNQSAYDQKDSKLNPYYRYIRDDILRG